MLSLSRLRPDPFGPPIFATSENGFSDFSDDSAFAARMVATLENGAQAALVVDGISGVTLAINALASALLKEQHIIKGLKSRLQAAEADQSASFVWRDAEDRVHLVRLTPVANSSSPQMLVLLTRVRQDEDLLFKEFVRRFGVTSAEARLLSALLKGDTLTDISLRLGLSTSTIKSQLRNLLSRTGTERQVALVAFYFSDEW